MDDVRDPQAASSAAQSLRLHGQAPLAKPFVPLRLVLHPGGATIDVDGPDVLVGRHTECDVRLPLPDVSRRHCRLQFIEGGWQVIDLSSLNGTQVNGEPITQASLNKGDKLKVGGFVFEVELAAELPPNGVRLESIVETLTGGSGTKRKAS